MINFPDNLRAKITKDYLNQEKKYYDRLLSIIAKNRKTP